MIAGGALGSAFIPIFAAYFVWRDAKGAWRLFSAIFNLVIIAATITSLVVALLAPDHRYIFQRTGGDPALRETMIALLRLLLVTPVLFGPAASLRRRCMPANNFVAVAGTHCLQSGYHPGNRSVSARCWASRTVPFWAHWDTC